jgi:hypothetical protein
MPDREYASTKNCEQGKLIRHAVHDKDKEKDYGTEFSIL